MTTRAVTWRLSLLSLSVVGMILCQGVSVLQSTGELWPFDGISVYKRFPRGNKSLSRNLVVFTEDEEIDVVQLENINFRLIRRFDGALRSAGTDAEAQEVLSHLFGFIDERSGSPLRIAGIRYYKIRWDFDLGRVTKSDLLHEYRRP